jgi:YVTN family beta-propeller protein
MHAVVSSKPNWRCEMSRLLAIVGLVAVVASCTSNSKKNDVPESLAHTLFVAHEGVLTSYDIATGAEREGTLTGISGPVNMQALADGTVLVNLSGSNEVLAFDGLTMVEKARIASSGTGGKRPVHSYITPARNGRQYWVALNDGENLDLATSSARFIDITDSETYLTGVGEVALGNGHHKATFSATRERVVFSSIADCNNVLGVYDYSDVANIQLVKKWSANDLGWDGSSYLKTCDPSFHTGAPPAPHGCATSKVSGKAYCSITTSGEIAAIDLDAADPFLLKLTTGGSGGGYTKAHPDGRYIYSLQESPREGAGGITCQIGALVVIDSSTDTVVTELPLLYKDPLCADVLTGSDEATAGPGHIIVSFDKKTLYIGTAGGFDEPDARVRQELVVDITDPANPVQRNSIGTGASVSHHDDTISGDGRFVFVANNKDGTVTQIDTTTNLVTTTIAVKPTPQTVTTFGTAEGPSHQTGPVE